MARLQSGVSPFTNGQTLTASDLNNHVTGASPLPDFIGLQTGLTTPASADEFLINDVSDGAVKKVTLENLAANMPATTVNALTVSTNAAVTGNLTVAGNTTIGDADTDSATFNAASSFGATATFNKPVVLNDNSTIGQTVISGTYARSTTTMTVTKVAHGLTTGNTFWFNVDNNPTLSGSYSITVTNVDTFTFTVANSGATSGNIYWYAKTATIQSTLAGTVQGDIVVNVAKTNVANGDEFLIKDSSDSNNVVIGTSVDPELIQAYVKDVRLIVVRCGNLITTYAKDNSTLEIHSKVSRRHTDRITTLKVRILRSRVLLNYADSRAIPYQCSLGFDAGECIMTITSRCGRYVSQCCSKWNTLNKERTRQVVMAWNVDDDFISYAVTVIRSTKVHSNC